MTLSDLKYIVEQHKNNNDFILLNGWSILRLYVFIRKMLKNNKLFHTDNNFVCIFVEKDIIVCDNEFNILFHSFKLKKNNYFFQFWKRLFRLLKINK